MGPYQYAMHLISGPRLPFTATYFGAIALTIYFAVGVSVPHASGRPGLTAAAAALHTSYVIIVGHPACCPGMVSCQLLPNGQHRSAVRRSSWRWKSGSVDERLNGSTACTDIILHLIFTHLPSLCVAMQPPSRPNSTRPC